MSANVYSTIMDTDRTVRDESMLDSGGESDVMDNIVFNRPMTRRMSKGKGAVLPPVASSSTTPTRRRSLRKSTSNATTPTRPRSSRRSSNTTSSPSSSVSQSQSQSQSSQSEPHAATDEPTGMSQELARVCVASQGKPNMEDAEPRTEGSVSPSESAHVPQPAAMEFDAAPFHVETDMGEQEGLEAGPRGARGATSASVFVFDTDMERASQPQPTREPKPGTAARTPLALPVFTVTCSPLPGDVRPEEHTTTSQVSMAVSDDTCDMSTSLPPPPPILDDTFDSSCSSSVTFDLSIPASVSSASSNSAVLPAPPRVRNIPRRSARLSGISATSTVSSVSSTLDLNSTSRAVKTIAKSKHILSIVPSTTPLHDTRKPKVKVKSQAQVPPTNDLVDRGPTESGRNAQPSAPLPDATIITTTNKDKTRERTTSSSSLSSIPSPLPPPTKPEPKLRSLSPDSEAVLTSLHQSLLPSTRPQLKPIAKSSDRPAALPSAMKRRNEDLEPSSPSKRARFDPDPPPIPPPLRSRSPESPRPTQSSQPTQSSHPSQSSQSSQTSQPSRSLPGRIRVHPPNSSFTKSTIGNSFLGSHPPIVVRGQSSPSRQQLLLQRPAGPPMRVPVGQQQQQQQRALFSSRVVSPIRTGSTNGLSTGSPSKLQHNDARNGAWGAHVTSKKTQIKPPEVLIAPASDRSSSPARAARPLSRLPLPAGRKAKEKTQPEVDGVGEGESPPAGSSATGSLAPAAAGGLDSASSTSATLDVPSALPRERTPPTPLETPASPGSSTSTLIMDVPLFYQPPAPRHPPIPSKTPEEIIAEGTAREAQRKREQGKTKAAAAGAAAMRCLPLTRAPKRIIPDGSALQAWASVSHATGPLTETQKELQKLTAENTERNNAYGCVIERTDTFVDLPRPPSPTSRVRTKAQKSRELERQSRNERAQRRSAARGEEADTSLGSTNAEERRLAPGDDGEWIEPVRKGRHVRWAQSLVHDDVDKGLRAPEPSAAAPVGRGCLARTYNLDRHGNMYGPAPTTDPLRVVIVRYVYSDEPAFKVWKRGQS